MPCTPEAVDVLVAPSMAAGVCGVLAGELELKECNLNWSPEDFESKQQEAMKQAYQRALKAATDFGYQKESPEGFGTWGSHFFVLDNCQQHGRSRLCIGYLSKNASMQALQKLLVPRLCCND